MIASFTLEVAIERADGQFAALGDLLHRGVEESALGEDDFGRVEDQLPLLEVVAARLGADGAVGTPLAVRDGRYRGRIVPPLGVGRGKAARMRDYLSGAGKGIDLAASSLYTDSFTDAPVLEMVGHPVAVYPDARLASLAAERGWPVIGWITNER